jgi:hypothetical protein
VCGPSGWYHDHDHDDVVNDHDQVQLDHKHDKHSYRSSQQSCDRLVRQLHDLPHCRLG